MNRMLKLVMILLLFNGMFYFLPVEAKADECPPAVVMGRYILQESKVWFVFNKTVQELRNEGYQVDGDPSWLLQANYTYLNHTLKCTIAKLWWSNVTLQNTEGKHDLNVTAHRIMEDGSIGEKLGSFLKTDIPARMGIRWESWNPYFGLAVNPSALVIGHSFSANGRLQYFVDRTEILPNTPWGQNMTYVLYGTFVNETHSFRTTLWCDFDSGILLKQIWDTKMPTHLHHEELQTIETGVLHDEFEVVQEGQTYKIPINTNSTINEFIFDTSTNKMSVIVNGSSGTSGTLNIAIPKSLAPTGCDVEVYIDDKKTDYQLTEDASNYYVYIEYQHSVHTITIAFATKPIWMQWWFLLTVGVSITVIVGTAYLLMKRKSTKLASSQTPSKVS